jgi:beta-N-acetylhexosaminidase
MRKIITRFFVLINKVVILSFLLHVTAVQGSFPLTLEEKIGQLFIIPACQLRGEDHFEDLERLIRDGKVGGIILKQGTADGQRALIDKLKSFSRLPLLFVQDGEWGVGMRLTDVLAFPRNLTLGAVQDLSLLFQLGQEIGRQCRLVGVHLNLAPVSDVNCNPQNPIIHMRSFGEDPVQVALRSQLVMFGIQSMGVLACAKHFPGHGDTSVDSHVDLPFITHDLHRLQRVELLPFQTLIRAGVKVIMSAHLCVEAIDELPVTFSHRVITDLLQNKLGFNGLVISDALNMKALSNRFSPDQIAIKALLAGHDLLLYGDHIAPNVDQILRRDIHQAIAALKAAVENQEISEEFIDAKVSKILKAKEELCRAQEDFVNFGLCETKSNRSKAIRPNSEAPYEKIDNLAEKINSPQARALKRKLFQEAITVVRGEELLALGEKKIALIEWGESPLFAAMIDADRFFLNDPELLEKVSRYSRLVISLSKYSTAWPNFGLEAQDEELLIALSKRGIPTVAVIFGTPYSLSKLPLFETIIVAYENANEAQEAAADVLLGKLSPKGKLPISIHQSVRW